MKVPPKNGVGYCDFVEKCESRMLVGFEGILIL